MSEVITPVTLTVTPQMLAQAFWDMGSDEQAQFFGALNQIISQEYATKPGSVAWSLGEMQWLYLGDALDKDKPAREMLMAMAAPMFMHTLAFAEARSA